MLKQEIDNALKVLLSSGTLLYPTDTLWGIGCCATDLVAVRKISSLKNREQDKSYILLVNNFQMLERYVKDIPNVAYDLIELADKPLTIVFSTPQNLPTELLAPDGSIAIRIVKHEFCQKLIEKLKKPLISTSANFSGMASPACFDDIDKRLIEQIDYVVQLEQELVSEKKASSIIQIQPNASFKILRP